MMTATAKQPLVTILIPAFNHEAFVTIALDSVASQAYHPMEIIVIDDASSDATASRVESWMNTQVDFSTRLIRKQANEGICAALNSGLNLAQGELFIILASDDWLGPGHVTDCVQTLLGNDAAEVAFSDLCVVEEDGTVLHESYLRMLGALPPPQGRIYSSIVMRNTVPAPGAAMRSDSVRDVGGFDESFSMEDFPMWLKLARRGELRWTGQRTVFYRSTPGSLSRSRHFERAQEIIEILDKELSQVPIQYKSALHSARATRAISLYAHAHGSEQMRLARRMLRQASTERPNLEVLVNLGASHLGIRYALVKRFRRRVALLSSSATSWFRDCRARRMRS